jgi:hypothetical protein
MDRFRALGLQSGMRRRFTVRLITLEGEKRYIEVAQRRQDESMMDADVVREYALQLWNDRTAHDGADQHGGAFAGQRAEALNRKSENAGEHGRIEESN